MLDAFINAAPFVDRERDRRTNEVNLSAFVGMAASAGVICFLRTESWAWLALYAAMIGLVLVPARRALREIAAESE